MTAQTIVPIVPGTFLYVNDLKTSVASNTTLSITSGQCRDSTNSLDMVLEGTTTLNTAVVGVNGIDTGVLAASSVYAVYVIGDQAGYNATATIMSLNHTQPLMPKGQFPSNYSSWRRVGWAFTDGSTHFRIAYQTGNGNYRKYFYDTPVSVLSGGSATSFTAVTLTTAVPDVESTEVSLNIAYTPNTAGNTLLLRPTGSAATTVLTFSGVVAAQPQYLQADMVSRLSSSVPKIDYHGQASDATTLLVLGYTDYI